MEKRNLEFESGGVFNPSCVVKDGVVHMFYRAVGKGNYSTIGYCQIKDGKAIERWVKPILTPEYHFEKEGIEDPRVTLLEGLYYMLYTAYDGENAMVAYATSKDLISWEKEGVISPRLSYDEAEEIFKPLGLDKRYTFYERYFQIMRSDGVLLWEKDTSMFSKRIKGKCAIIHRILPCIQVCYFDTLKELSDDFWRRYLKELDKYVVLEPKFWFENAYVGGGCPPIETDEGWLLIYHAVQVKDGRKIYRAGAALLDIDEPRKVIGRLKEPLFEPEEDWEKTGTIDNVVFPTGAVITGDELEIYYGAGDSRIGKAKVDLKQLLEVIKKE